MQANANSEILGTLEAVNLIGNLDAVRDFGNIKNKSGEIVEKDVPEPDDLSENHTWEFTGEKPEYQTLIIQN